MDSKQKVFEQLKHINGSALREFCKACLESAPEYFWRVSASSTGNFHPTFAQGEGGLLRHTLAAVEVAAVLFPAYPELEEHRDEILVALLLHDTCKRGMYEDEGRTAEEHELLPLMRYRHLWQKIDPDTRERIVRLIVHHMGRWGVLGPPPKKDGYRVSPEEFVHLCDYIASSRKLEDLFRKEW